MIDVTFASVEEAVRTLHGVAHYTRVLTSCQLDALSGARVFLKGENFQRIEAVLTGGDVEWLRPWPRLAGCGKTISARENFDGPHVRHNRRTLVQDAQKGRSAGRSERRGEGVRFGTLSF